MRAFICSVCFLEGMRGEHVLFICVCSYRMCRGPRVADGGGGGGEWLTFLPYTT